MARQCPEAPCLGLQCHSVNPSIASPALEARELPRYLDDSRETLTNFGLKTVAFQIDAFSRDPLTPPRLAPLLNAVDRLTISGLTTFRIRNAAIDLLDGVWTFDECLTNDFSTQTHVTAHYSSNFKQFYPRCLPLVPCLRPEGTCPVTSIILDMMHYLTKYIHLRPRATVLCASQI